MTKIRIGKKVDPDNCNESTWTEIEVNAGHDVELSEVYNGVGIMTDMGIFGIACRDDGIEVMLNGGLVWSSHEIGDETKSTPFGWRKEGGRWVKSKEKYAIVGNNGCFWGGDNWYPSQEFAQYYTEEDLPSSIDKGRGVLDKRDSRDPSGWTYRQKDRQKSLLHRAMVVRVN
jgi:hypothetical protein